MLDAALRAEPEAAYGYETLFGAMAQRAREAAGSRLHHPRVVQP
jgi:hypothetical protein